MKTYTMQEACNALAIDNATLFRWMKRAGIYDEVKQQEDEQDKRRRVLSHAQVVQLAKLHRRALTQSTARPDTSELALLTSRIEKLERDVSETRAALDRLTATRTHHTPAPSKSDVARPVGEALPLPDGWTPIIDLIKQYNKPETSVMRHMRPYLQAGPWKTHDGRTISYALDPEGLAEFIRRYG